MRRLALISGLAAVTITACSATVTSSADEARLKYCASLGAQMITMMQIGNGDTASLDPERVQQGSQTLVTAAQDLEDADSDAPRTLSEDTELFALHSDQPDAGPALDRIHQYCVDHKLDPMK